MERLAEPTYAPRISRVDVRLAVGRIRDEGLLVCVVGVYVAVLCSRLAMQVGQDGWLMLVAGRDIVAHGIPTHDHLTYWTMGNHWVDQQWLGQLLYYGLVSAGGLTLALFAHVAFLTATLVIALVLARMQGATARATAWAVVITVVPIVSGSWQMRTQVLGLLLFVALLWLLIGDERAPSRRVFLAIPLLALWANVHGSVLVGVAVVVLYALCSDHARSRRGIFLVLGAAGAVLSTPYGFAAIAYYKATIFNTGFGSLVTEWRPLTLRPATVPIYLLALGGIWLLASRGGRVSLFQKAVFLLSVVLALLAIRNIAFVGLTGLIVLPQVLDEVLPQRSASRRLDTIAAAAAALLVLVSVPMALRAAATGVGERFPREAAVAVARAADTDPNARVFADVKFADWLLWESPELEGRLAYDARFELLTYGQLRSAYYWTNQVTAGWKNAARGARVIVLDPDATALNERPLLAEDGVRRLYKNGEIVVLERAHGS
jgi:hypothetical protein